MIPLLILGLCSLFSASSSDPVNYWTTKDAEGKTCIKMYAQIDLALSYTKEDGTLADPEQYIPVPSDATTTQSSCDEQILIGDQYIPSQVLQLNFPKNEGWNVRLFFTQDSKLGVDEGNWALWQVTVTANYASMPEIFVNTPKDPIHTYFSVIDFDNPPSISADEHAKMGDYIDCSPPLGFIINRDAENGPSASVRLQNVQMQAYMTTEDFGNQSVCEYATNVMDSVPIIVSCALAGFILIVLAAYLIYRSRHPAPILDVTQPVLEDHKKESSDLHHHDNYGYKEDE